jgi:hypothetical protein
MKTDTIFNYVLNCMLLLLPILLWNVLFAARLPKAFSSDFFEKDIPVFVAGGENFFRLAVFILPILMPLRIVTDGQKLGLALYIGGSCVYFLAWLALMVFPHSAWSLSAVGFLAPAYTPLIWLAGIGLIGSTLYFSSPYRSWMYIALSIVFVGFHFSHTLMVYLRTL